jgi:hypothetical protein
MFNNVNATTMEMSAMSNAYSAIVAAPSFLRNAHHTENARCARGTRWGRHGAFCKPRLDVMYRR